MLDRGRISYSQAEEMIDFAIWFSNTLARTDLDWNTPSTAVNLVHNADQILKSIEGESHE